MMGAEKEWVRVPSRSRARTIRWTARHWACLSHAKSAKFAKSPLIFAAFANFAWDIAVTGSGGISPRPDVHRDADLAHPRLKRGESFALEEFHRVLSEVEPRRIVEYEVSVLWFVLSLTIFSF